MATWLSGISKQLRTIRTNAFAWCGIYFLVFLLLILRLFWLQIIAGHHYRQEAERYRNRETILPATRGRLLDRNLAVLALDDQRPSLYADPSLVLYPEYAAQLLAPVLQRPQNELLAEFTRQVPFAWIKRHLTPEMTAGIARLNIPQLQIKPDGSRYRIGVDLAQVPQVPALIDQLAKTLDLSTKEVRAQLGVPEVANKAAGTAAVAALPLAGQRWVRGIYDEDVKAALTAAKLPGLTFQVDSPSYSLGIDPRIFAGNTPGLTASGLAEKLAPVLKMSPTEVEGHLQYRPRFAWLKRNLTPEMAQTVQQMESTVYVVEPGKVPDLPASYKGDEVGLTQAVDRLYKLINPKGKPEQISREEIRRRLSPGAAPGPLGTVTNNGQPSVLAERSLLLNPIPGVTYGLTGVSLQRERRRTYPFNTLASATMGFVTYDNHVIKGAFGLEHTEDKILSGVDGREIKEIDARHVTIPEHSQRIEPINGRDIELTLDLSIQQAAEEELAKSVQESHALRGECLVMDSNTGEILAMASCPTWDSNAPAARAPGQPPLPLLNPIVSNFYEPGSTFKLVAVMAALEEGVIHDGQNVTYCSGAFPVGGHTIHESHNAHGEVDCGRLLEQSCNIGAASLSLRLGPDRFLKWCDRLGFGQKTGIEVAQESPGYLNRRNVNAKITLACMGFGQSLAVTPLQMLAAYSAVANGGYLVKPHLVKARMRPDGTMEQVSCPRKQVCSSETARLIRGYLERVVTKGTAKNAKIPGYRLAGKTGTAQKVGERGYGGGRYIGSFIGFMPVEHPRLTMIAVIDEPKGSHYGAVVAAPVVREVGKRAMQYLNILPTEQIEKPGHHATAEEHTH